MRELILNGHTIIYISLLIYVLLLVLVLLMDKKEGVSRVHKRQNEDALNEVEAILKEPTRQNIIKAAHIYSAVSSMHYKEKRGISYPLSCHLLDLLNKESDNPITTESITPTFVLANPEAMKGLIYDNLDSLYVKNEDNKEETRAVRNLDAAFEMVLHSCDKRYKSFIEGNMEDDVSLLARDLLVLYAKKHDLQLDYLPFIGVSVGETWVRNEP